MGYTIGCWNRFNIWKHGGFFNYTIGKVLHVIYVFILITVNLVALCGSIKKSMWYDKIKQLHFVLNKENSLTSEMQHIGVFSFCHSIFKRGEACEKKKKKKSVLDGVVSLKTRHHVLMKRVRSKASEKLQIKP